MLHIKHILYISKNSNPETEVQYPNYLNSTVGNITISKDKQNNSYTYQTRNREKMATVQICIKKDKHASKKTKRPESNELLKIL